LRLSVRLLSFVRIGHTGLAHSASFHTGEKTAPSNPRTKRIGYLEDAAAEPVDGTNHEDVELSSHGILEHCIECPSPIVALGPANTIILAGPHDCPAAMLGNTVQHRPLVVGSSRLTRKWSATRTPTVSMMATGSSILIWRGLPKGHCSGIDLTGICSGHCCRHCRTHAEVEWFPYRIHAIVHMADSCASFCRPHTVSFLHSLRSTARFKPWATPAPGTCVSEAASDVFVALAKWGRQQ
jgi:hypothetical protein